MRFRHARRWRGDRPRGLHARSARYDGAVDDPRPLDDPPEADERDLRREDHAVHLLGTALAEARDGDRGVGQLGRAEAPTARAVTRSRNAAMRSPSGARSASWRAGAIRPPPRRETATPRWIASHRPLRLLPDRVQLGVLAEGERDGLDEQDAEQEAVGQRAALVLGDEPRRRRSEVDRLAHVVVRDLAVRAGHRGGDRAAHARRGLAVGRAGAAVSTSPRMSARRGRFPQRRESRSRAAASSRARGVLRRAALRRLVPAAASTSRKQGAPVGARARHAATGRHARGRSAERAAMPDGGRGGRGRPRAKPGAGPRSRPRAAAPPPVALPGLPAPPAAAARAVRRVASARLGGHLARTRIVASGVPTGTSSPSATRSSPTTPSSKHSTSITRLLGLDHGDDVAALHGVARLREPLDDGCPRPCRRRATAYGTRRHHGRPPRPGPRRRSRAGCGRAASSRCRA